MRKLLIALTLFFAGYMSGDEIHITDRTLTAIESIRKSQWDRMSITKSHPPAVVVFAKRRGFEENAFADALLDYSEKECSLGHIQNAIRAIGYAAEIPGTNILSRLKEQATTESLIDVRVGYLRSYVRKTPAESVPFVNMLWPDLKPGEKVALIELLENMKRSGGHEGLDLWDEYLREMLGNETDELVAKGIREYIAIAMQNQDTVAHVGPAAKAGGNVP